MMKKRYDGNEKGNSPQAKRIKLLHYNGTHSTLEFEFNVPESSDTENDDVLLSDITFTGSESDNSQKYIIFCHPDCCWNIEEEAKDFLIKTDQTSQRNRNVFMMSYHPGLTHTHRSYLLDWLMEISEFFRVSRDTYYQTLDILDRFLSANKDQNPHEMPLVGITSLYIASKFEEVNSIEIVDLIFLTDDVFTEENVLNMEKEVLQTIDWGCSVWTANKWLLTFIHLIKYTLSPWEYIKVTDLIDLVTFDIDSLNFSYSVLASTCLYLVTSINVLFPYNNETQQLNICECVYWAKNYWEAIKTSPLPQNMHKHQMSIDHKCKLLNYSVCQRYSKLLNIYNNVKDNLD